MTSVRCLRLLSSMCRTSEIDGRCVHLRGSDRCEISYAAILTQSMCRSTFEDPIDVNFIIGASLSEPHTYRTAVQNPPYWRAERAPLSVELSAFSLYLYIYIYIYIFQAVRRARAVNALRANVGPAG